MIRHIRWQAVIAIVGVILIVALLGYVALTTFTREAGRNVANAIRELKKENPELCLLYTSDAADE